MSDEREKLESLAEEAYRTYCNYTTKSNVAWWELEWEKKQAWIKVVEELLREIGMRQFLK